MIGRSIDLHRQRSIPSPVCCERLSPTPTKLGSAPSLLCAWCSAPPRGCTHVHPRAVLRASGTSSPELLSRDFALWSDNERGHPKPPTGARHGLGPGMLMLAHQQRTLLDRLRKQRCSRPLPACPMTSACNLAGQATETSCTASARTEATAVLGWADGRCLQVAWPGVVA